MNEHYKKGDIDIITFLNLYFNGNDNFTVGESFMVGNIIKYVCRYKDKNGVEDLEKAKDYVERLIKLYE